MAALCRRQAEGGAQLSHPLSFLQVLGGLEICNRGQAVGLLLFYFVFGHICAFVQWLCFLCVFFVSVCPGYATSSVLILLSGRFCCGLIVAILSFLSCAASLVAWG